MKPILFYLVLPLTGVKGNDIMNSDQENKAYQQARSSYGLEKMVNKLIGGVKMELKEILKSSITFRYQLLSRLQMDCNYYLGNGDRMKKTLWSGDEKEQINTMKQLWKSFSTSDKPEWLTWNDIKNYESKMI